MNMRFFYILTIFLAINSFSNEETPETLIENLSIKIGKELSSIKENKMRVEQNILKTKNELKKLLDELNSNTALLQKINNNRDNLNLLVLDDNKINELAEEIDENLSQNYDTEINKLKNLIQLTEDELDKYSEEWTKYENILIKYDLKKEIIKHQEKFLDDASALAQEDELYNLLKIVFVYETLLSNQHSVDIDKKPFLLKLQSKISEKVKKLNIIIKDPSLTSLDDLKTKLLDQVSLKKDDVNLITSKELQTDFNSSKKELKKINNFLKSLKAAEKELSLLKEKKVVLMQEEEAHRGEIRDINKKIKELNSFITVKNKIYNDFSEAKKKLSLISLKIIFYTSKFSQEIIYNKISSKKENISNLKIQLSLLQNNKENFSLKINVHKLLNTKKSLDKLILVQKKYEQIEEFLIKYNDILEKDPIIDELLKNSSKNQDMD